MRTFIVSAAFILLAIGAGAWLLLSLSAKAKHDRVRKELAGSVYTVAPFDQTARAFLDEVETAWTRGADETNSASSEVVRLAGLSPCVSNLVYVFNYEMPEYSWLHSAQNRKAALFGLLKAKFFPTSVDRAWHVSNDGHLVLLWCRTNMVYVYRDVPTGMRETLFYRKEQIVEPDGPANGSQPIRSETNRTSPAVGSRR